MGAKFDLEGSFGLAVAPGTPKKQQESPHRGTKHARSAQEEPQEPPGVPREGPKNPREALLGSVPRIQGGGTPKRPSPLARLYID